jgi:hypothetical protein
VFLKKANFSFSALTSKFNLCAGTKGKKVPLFCLPTTFAKVDSKCKNFRFLG